MRFIIFGVGAIGGVLAVRLTLAGHEVVGIARGAQFAAIRDNGLTMRTPDRDLHARFAIAASPSEIQFRADDVIFLTMKSQDTEPALRALRAAGLVDQTVVSAQNGVVNERMALRYFPNVLGMSILMPVDYVTPGEVICFGTPKHGLFDIGRYPSGTDDSVAALCDVFDAAGFVGYPHDDIMRAKYGKLLLNLGNGIDAALGGDSLSGRYVEMVRKEGEAVYAAAGIGYEEVWDADSRRRELMRIGEIPGVSRIGSSTAQSLARGAGSIETDYLNGEIALIGRLHGVPVPANALFTALSARLALTGASPGSVTEAEIEALLAKGK